MMISKARTFVLLLILTLSLSPHKGHAEKKVLFEGYYKISLFSEHVGFFVQRYELDTKKKTFLSTYFLKTNKKGGDIAESLKAESTSDLKPIKYQYTALLGTTTKTIDANVLKDKLHLRISKNGKMSPKTVTIKEGTFLSTFLAYMLLQGKKGLSPGVKYSYKAIAEEEGKVLSGDAFIQLEEKHKGTPSYKVLNTFKNTQFVNFITSDGSSLRSLSPSSGLNAELVANPDDATRGLPSAETNLIGLFGNIPKGDKHPLFVNNSKPAPPRRPTESPSTPKKPKKTK